MIILDHYKPITVTNHSEEDLSDIDFYSNVWFKCTCIFLFRSRRLTWLLWHSDLTVN